MAFIDHYFVSRVGLVSKSVGQGDVELIGCAKQFLFLLLQASSCYSVSIPISIVCKQIN